MKRSAAAPFHRIVMRRLECRNVKPYQQRVIEEKQDLDLKAKKLSAFIGSSSQFVTLPQYQQELLREQCEIMWQYSEILGKRIAAFASA